MPRLPLDFWLVKTLVSIVTFLLVRIALDVAQVCDLILFLLDYLGSIDLGGWTFSLLASMMFFGVLGLRLISNSRGLGLSLFLESLIGCSRWMSSLSFLDDGQ